MLWQKGWLETRFRLLFTLGMIAFNICVQYAANAAQNSISPSQYATAAAISITQHTYIIVFYAITFGSAIQLTVICAMLAGAGVATQPTFQATKGLHGSTLFTLSLPVSRLRLLAVRAAIGWLEFVAEIAILCSGIWLVYPLIRMTTPPAQMGEYALTLVVCGSALYFLSVLFATLFDDQWRAWGTMVAAVATGWISHKAWLPASIDIGQAIAKRSPLIAHTMPWPAMVFSIALAAAFFLAALKVAQTREY